MPLLCVGLDNAQSFQRTGIRGGNRPGKVIDFDQEVYDLADPTGYNTDLPTPGTRTVDPPPHPIRPMDSRISLVFLFCCFTPLACQAPDPSLTKRPNILIISLDDMNNWIEPMGGHPQAQTPNLESFSKSSMTFRRAYTASPSCNPSRTALFSGKAPWVTGVYNNPQIWRHVVGDEKMMPEYFRDAGY